MGDLPSCQELIEKLLTQAINIGIKEYEFWDMTISEIQREADGIKFRRTEELKAQAQFVHLLPQLIAVSIAGLLDKNAKEYPPIEEVFSGLYSDSEREEVKEQKRNEANIAKFLQFANTYNKQFSEVN